MLWCSIVVGGFLDIARTFVNRHLTFSFRFRSNRRLATAQTVLYRSAVSVRWLVDALFREDENYGRFIGSEILRFVNGLIFQRARGRIVCLHSLSGMAQAA